MDQAATRSDIQEVLTIVRELSTHVERLSEKLDATKEQLVNHTNGIAAELHLQIQSAETRLTTKISAVEKRLELQGGLIQSGVRAMGSFHQVDRENGYRTLWLRTSTDVTGDACQ